mmetsp:Transcript_15290/g.39328  ORF Transcript_15290/g.39328 Transcript_15290/m.39328 type:complete len:188 (+) Transcript_15290:57-620(+)|eukprot:CAMPEP_0182926890 /NCGR_PEP_ID=MMETSP0105_2-20130417/12568_1 /TAXON_ID=81532 ORGANISM="Acanthoeca-like sp., Strain 10tr" /NCGR_SAMPLE_ID=MMETSP0105_2 /ASSEMBLY_ACC=CAM_ASM_000205 /LENGTH=187 /DNA_ID=CAMNT_0025064807 /DNA_START=50 /DNA_END=613 /DNA_ORIENTATION=-
MSASELQALSQLLGGSLQDDTSHLELDDGAPAPGAAMTPANIGPAKPRKRPATNKPTKDIWDADEVKAEDRGLEDDERPSPEYDVLYKQAVSSEDMYLGMSGRDPSTHWCDDMVLRIKLPNHQLADCDLEVTAEYLDLRTPRYRLGMHLPHPCDPDAGSAKFDKAKGELTVTLKMNRELDFLKFGEA